MEYLEQSYKSIIFYLVNTVLDQKVFNIVSKHQFEHENMRIEFGVLTESHYVSVTEDDATLYEVCACKEYDFDTLQKANIEDVAETTVAEDIGNFSYTFTSDIKNYRDGKKILNQLESKQRNSVTHYLTHTFPGRWAWSRPAITEIYVTPKNGGLIVETVHTYPNESKMVFTTSEITNK